MMAKTLLHIMVCVISFAGLLAINPAHAQTQKYLLMEGQQLPPLIERNQGIVFEDPEFDNVKYLKLEPPKSLRERIDRLIHGSYVDLPPEYDHYGYEIRKYMAHVGGPLIPASTVNLKGQLQNIQSAKKIAELWRKKQLEEIRAIETKMEEHASSSSYRPKFKYNAGTVKAFFTELDSWLDNNEALLEYLLEIGPNAYTYEAPVFKFKDNKQRMSYARLYDAQLRSLEVIRKYPPFRVMLY